MPRKDNATYLSKASLADSPFYFCVSFIWRKKVRPFINVEYSSHVSIKNSFKNSAESCWKLVELVKMGAHKLLQIKYCVRASRYVASRYFAAYRRTRWLDANDSAFERAALNATTVYVRARIRALFEKNERENKCAQARAHTDARAETTMWSTVRLLLFERQANTWLRARRPSRQRARIYACAGAVKKKFLTLSSF